LAATGTEGLPLAAAAPAPSPARPTEPAESPVKAKRRGLGLMLGHQLKLIK
jgi:hypothetical protein